MWPEPARVSFNQDFKRYLLEKGINIDTAMFDLRMQPPQNFASYRQSELDNARVGTFTQMSAVPYVSNRFALKRFLGLSAEEVADNEKLWREENDENIEPIPTDAAGEMRGAGVSAAGMTADMSGMEDEAVDPDAPAPEDGGDGTPPETVTGETPLPGGEV